MKGMNKYIALAMMVLLASACSKDELAPRETKQDVQEASQMINYSTAVTTPSYDAIDVKAEEDDDLRATITSNGYAVPSLEITTADINVAHTKAHWGVVGQGTHREGTIATVLNARPSATEEPTNALLIEEANPKNLIKMYFALPNTIEPKKVFGWLGLGGKMKIVDDYLTLSYTTADGTAPNAKVQGLKSGQKQVGVNIPLITPIVPFENIISNPNRAVVKFKPRGVLLSLSIINKLSQNIVIKDIVLEKNNSLAFEGYFRLYKTTGTGGIINKTPGQGGATADLKFVTARNNEEIIYPVYKGTSPGYTLAPVTGTVTQAIKDALPVFNIWGIGNEYREDPAFDQERQPLTLRIRYTKAGSSEVKTSTAFRILNVSGDADQGKSYRVTLPIDEYAEGVTFPEDIIKERLGTYLRDFSPNLLRVGLLNVPPSSINSVEDAENLAFVKRSEVNASNINNVYYMPAKGHRYYLSPGQELETSYPNHIFDFAPTRGAFVNIYHPRNHFIASLDGEGSLYSVTVFDLSVLFPMTLNKSKDANELYNQLDQCKILIKGTPQATSINKVMSQVESQILYTSPGESLPYNENVVLDNVTNYIQNVPDPQHSGTGIVYALRFVGTKWMSAWQYRWEGSIAQNNQRLVISCVPLKSYLEVTPQNVSEIFDKIKHPEFFTRTYADHFYLPYLGYKTSENGAITRSQGSVYWLASPSIKFRENPFNYPFPLQYLLLPNNPSQELKIINRTSANQNIYKFAPNLFDYVDRSRTLYDD